MLDRPARPYDFSRLGNEVSPLGVEQRLPAGGLLWKEGDAGDSVAILLEGMLEVVHEGPGAEVVVLRTLEAGAIVGDIATLDGRGRSATVRACSPVRYLQITATEFRELLKRRPEILEALYWMQADLVRSLTRQVSRNHHRAITDPLTHLYNYGYLCERLEIEVERARQTGDHITLAMFDIDHFKHYNDHNGHEEGNRVLVLVADILRQTARRGDIIARYGGEEFVALLYGATLSEGMRLAEWARRAVESRRFAGGEKQPDGRLTISAGVAVFPDDARDDHGLVRAADLLLYQAKESGRNRIVPAIG